MPERAVAVHRTASAMLRGLELETLVPQIVQAAKLIGRADAAALMLVDEAEGALRVVAHEGLTDAYAAGRRFPLERARAIYPGFDSHVDKQISPDEKEDASLLYAGIRHIVAMPLVRDDELLGSISVYSRDREHRLDAFELDLLHVLAAQASIAITNARLYEAERQARRLQESILESLNDGVVIAFTDGRMQLNRVARETLGVTDGERPSRSDLRPRFELRHEDGTPVDAQANPMDRALRGEANSGVYVQRDLSSGADHAYRFEAAPVRDAAGAIVAGVVSMHDLTEQREADRQKDEFLSIVSHELKTPLTPLKALAQLLRLRLRRHRTDGRELDLNSLDSNLRTIERQVDRMAGLVNDLLEVSRAGQGRFQLQPQEFDLVPVVRDVVQRHSEIAAEDGRHRFSLETPDSVVMVGDAMRIEQAVANLIGNAVKYSPSGGDVRVGVKAENGTVAIAVRDEGIGIAAEDLPTLGRPFARGSRRAQTFSGMGIGLYLARLVAERHGGKIELESEGEDKGTTVTLELAREGPPRS